jgi:hypothetical protein
MSVAVGICMTVVEGGTAMAGRAALRGKLAKTSRYQFRDLGV